MGKGKNQFPGLADGGTSRALWPLSAVLIFVSGIRVIMAGPALKQE